MATIFYINLRLLEKQIWDKKVVEEEKGLYREIQKLWGALVALHRSQSFLIMVRDTETLNEALHPARSNYPILTISQPEPDGVLDSRIDRQQLGNRMTEEIEKFKLQHSTIIVRLDFINQIYLQPLLKKMATDKTSQSYNERVIKEYIADRNLIDDLETQILSGINILSQLTSRLKNHVNSHQQIPKNFKIKSTINQHRRLLNRKTSKSTMKKLQQKQLQKLKNMATHRRIEWPDLN